ncbi:MAG: hypothetical protein HYU64_04550 [Armatimonadetes bacterium]|nr:hypothetical protein [Armatimonadota bacterium]
MGKKQIIIIVAVIAIIVGGIVIAKSLTTKPSALALLVCDSCKASVTQKIPVDTKFPVKCGKCGAQAVYRGAQFKCAKDGTTVAVPMKDTEHMVEGATQKANIVEDILSKGGLACPKCKAKMLPVAELPGQ